MRRKGFESYIILEECALKTKKDKLIDKIMDSYINGRIDYEQMRNMIESVKRRYESHKEAAEELIVNPDPEHELLYRFEVGGHSNGGVCVYQDYACNNKDYKSLSQHICNAYHATKHILCRCLCFDIRIATLDARII